LLYLPLGRYLTKKYLTISSFTRVFYSAPAAHRGLSTYKVGTAHSVGLIKTSAENFHKLFNYQLVEVDINNVNILS